MKAATIHPPLRLGSSSGGPAKPGAVLANWSRTLSGDRVPIPVRSSLVLVSAATLELQAGHPRERARERERLVDGRETASQAS